MKARVTDDLLGKIRSSLKPERQEIGAVMNRVQSSNLPLLNFFAETLRETLVESGFSQAEISRRCGIPAPHLTQMKQDKRRCTPEYELRLSRFFGITPGMWMNLQLDYEFMHAECGKGVAIRKEVQPHTA